MFLSAVIGAALVVAGIALLKVDVSVRATGQVYSPDERRVFSPADGVLAARHVELGQVVRAGEPLLELDQTDLVQREIELDRAIAEAESALARQDLALRRLEIRPIALEVAAAPARRERLGHIAAIYAEIHSNLTRGVEQQSVSEFEARRQLIERLRSEIELAEAEVLARWLEGGLPELERREAELERDRLARALALLRRERDLVASLRASRVIRAPIDGQVVALFARHPGMSVSRGMELAKVAPTGGPVHVRARIPERNVDLVRAGTPALMESRVFDSFLEGPVRGSVIRVAPDADSTAAQPLYEVEIAVGDTPHPLVLGSSLDVRLQLGRRSLFELMWRNARAELRGTP